MSLVHRLFIIFAIIVAFNLLFTNAYSQQQTIQNIQCIITNTQTTIGDCFASAIPLSFLGIALSFFMIGIAYIGGELLNYNQLKGFYRRELWESIKSMIIIAVVFASLIITSSIATSLAGNSGQLQQSSASLTSNLASLYTTVNASYLYPQLQDAYINFGAILGLSVGNDVLGTFQLSTWFPVPIPISAVTIVARFGSNANIFDSNFITSITDKNTFSLVNQAETFLVIPVLLVFQFQYNLLYIVAAVALGVFLPIGIILRAIPFLRGIGGTLIALAIGLAIIYPALLIGFNLPITNYMYSISPTKVSQQCPSSSTLVCNLWNSFNYLINTVNNASASTIGVFTGAFPLKLAFGNQITGTNLQKAETVSGQGFLTGLYGPILGQPLSSQSGEFPALNFIVDNSLNSIVQFILFAFDIVIWYAITNGIANLMGGNIQLGIGKKFKLA